MPWKLVRGDFSFKWAHPSILEVFKWGLESVGQLRMGGQVGGIPGKVEAQSWGNWRYMG